MSETSAIATEDKLPDLDSVDVLTVLQAWSDPVRLEIVRQLADTQGGKGLMCNQLRLPVAKSTGSHHLKTLLAAGITVEKEEGTRKYLRLRRDDLERRFPGLLESVLQTTSAPPAPGAS